MQGPNVLLYHLTCKNLRFELLFSNLIFTALNHQYREMVEKITTIVAAIEINFLTFIVN